ncbi:MAG: GNAT family N-acetyltransferase [Pseudomonadales bacterium]
MVTIREATSDDVDIVYELIIAIAAHHRQKQYVVTDKNELLNSGFGESPKFGVLLAEVAGEVAGYVSYTWNYSIWLGSRYMGIDDVFVWQKFRGQRVGEALMHKARDVSRTHGVSHIRWEVQKDNHAAIKFYQRLGATLDTKGVFRWDDVATEINDGKAR